MLKIRTIKSLIFAVIILIVHQPSTIWAQNFSCPIGKRPSCIEYGDTVCSRFGRCVDQDAACFDSYQCNYEGFTCRSNLTECIREYDDLVKQYNKIRKDYNSIVHNYNSIISVFNEMTEKITEIEIYLLYARNLDDARLCSY